MDRSFLSDDAVIEAARKFVCIRIATYEDQDEADFIKEHLMGGSGDLRNFGFALASSDFKEIFRRSERGPNFVYENAAEMAKELHHVAENHQAKRAEADQWPAVPEMKNVRLALNVASCDGLPGLLVVAGDEASLTGLKHNLSMVVWDKEISGLYVYGSTTAREQDLKMVKGDIPESGYLIVRPDAYGMKAEVIASLPADLSGDDLKSKLLSVASDYKRISKTHGTHVRGGRQSGFSWQTEVQVPDRRRNARSQ